MTAENATSTMFFRLRWRIVVIAVTLSIVVCGALAWAHRQPVETRYQPRRSLPVDSAYWNTDGVPFRVEERQLFVSIDGDEVELELPSALANSMSWRVVISENEQFLILNCERGMAVWEASAPFAQLHVWGANQEPLAGRGTGGVRTLGDVRYDLHELDVGFTLSPDGSRVCIHATQENAGRFDDSQDGVVILRDVATGEDITQFVHKDWGRVVDKVEWSPDGTLLATYSSYQRQDDYTIHVWDLATGQPITDISCIAKHLRFTSDGERLIVLSELYPQTLSIYSTRDGALLESLHPPTIRTFHLSPDGDSIAVVGAATGLFTRGHDRIELLDTTTLERRWSATCPGAIGRVVFRADGQELAASWFVPNELFGSSGGVRAWDATDGTIVLDDPELMFSGGLYYRDDGSLQAGNCVFEPITPGGVAGEDDSR